jgi:hypothetical protein
MSDTDLRESKKLFSHQKQEKEMLVLSQISPFGTLNRCASQDKADDDAVPSSE